MARILPNWIDGFLELEKNTEPSTLYKEWCAVFCIAAALQGKCWTYVGRHRNSPSLCIILVGPPAAGKGTAMEPVSLILEDADIQTSPEAVPGKGLFQALEAARDRVDFSDDTFIWHSSLSVVAEEFSLFTGRGQGEFIDFLNRILDGKRPSFRDKAAGRAEYNIPGPWLNILGGITPSTLQEALPRDSFEGGFGSRSIFVYSSGIEDCIAWDETTPREREIYDSLVRDLSQTRTLKGAFTWTPEGKKAYIKWRRRHFKNPPQLGAELAGYINRGKVHYPRIAMIQSAARGDDMLITVEDFARAVELLERTERLMPKAFENYGENPLLRAMKSIAVTIKRRGEIRYSELLTLHMKDVSIGQFRECIVTLRRQNFCEQIFEPGNSDAIIKHRP